MKLNKVTLLAVFFYVFVPGTAPAADLTVEEIVARAEKAAYYAGNDGKADIKMTITDKQKRKRIREFTVFRMDLSDGGEQKFYVYFKKPEDVRDMVYMVWKHLGKDDDRWLYLPALDLVRRIASGDKRSSFVGSNFVYEDISGRSLKEDTHELLETTEKHYKIKNTPKNKKSVEFVYYYVWIDKNTFMPFKAEYYDKQDKLYKTIEALETKDIQGHSTVLRSKATDLNTGSNTVSEFGNVEYDIGLKENMFTERSLKRPPRRWIK